MTNNPTPPTKTMRAKISQNQNMFFGHFSPEMAGLLIEFSNYISKLDSDYIIFMARKSLRLYDALVSIGMPEAQAPVYSDLIIDQNHPDFAGKTISLIDDTLILGTTLGGSKKSLIDRYDCAVTSHVLCASDRYWEDRIIRPEKVFGIVSHDDLMTFCASEVLALSSLSIPYLVDFPITLPVCFTPDQMNDVFSDFDWKSHKVSELTGDGYQAITFSIIPSNDALSKVIGVFGQGAQSLIDIFKVRAFARKEKKKINVTFVPIITFRPMPTVYLDIVFENALAVLNSECHVDRDLIRFHLVSPQTKIRFLQYIMAATFGMKYFNDLISRVQGVPDIYYSTQESDRHYGRWLRGQFDLVHTNCPNLTWGGKNSIFDIGTKEKDFRIPDSIMKMTDPDAFSLPNGEIFSDDEFDGENPSRNVLTDVSQFFLELFWRYELPAREEAKRLGQRIISANPEEAPNRNRLNYGVPWYSIVGRICREYKIPNSRPVALVLSLVLDHLVDMGIAVPINCVIDGYIFRAYRHGEDIPFADQETMLVQKLATGFLNAAGVESIPRIFFEKLLVIMFRVGVSKGFLKPIYGTTGTEGVARIGFHLYGAVPIMPKQDSGYFVEKKSSWLSSYLVSRDAFLIDQNTREYRLGRLIEGSAIRSHAALEAERLGSLLGLLARLPASSGQDKPLTSTNMIMLATCITPKDVTLALAAEVHYFIRWFDRRGSYAINLVDVNSKASIASAYSQLVDVRSNYGYAALRSGCEKYIGYRSNVTGKITENCSKYLRSQAFGGHLEIDWRSIWEAISKPASVHELESFSELINDLANILLELLLYMFSIELGLAAARIDAATISGDELEIRSRARTISCIRDMLRYTAPDPYTKRLARRLIDSGSGIADSNDAYRTIMFGKKHIEKRKPHCLRVVESAERISVEFKRQSQRIEFDYFLWYEIRRKGVASVQDIQDDDYDAVEVRSIVNQTLKEIVYDAQRMKTFVYPTDGIATLENAGRYVFVKGPYNVEWIAKISLKIWHIIKRHENITVRMVVAPCSLSGSRAFKHKHEPAVEGKMFWESATSIIEKTSATDKQHHNQAVSMHVVTERLLGMMKQYKHFEFDAHSTQDINVGSEGFSAMRFRVTSGAPSIKADARKIRST